MIDHDNLDNYLNPVLYDLEGSPCGARITLATGWASRVAAFTYGIKISLSRCEQSGPDQKRLPQWLKPRATRAMTTCVGRLCLCSGEFIRFI